MDSLDRGFWDPPQRRRTRRGASPAASVAGDNAGLTLSPGFCATLFADHLGHARHLAVAGDGSVYVNTWSGDYYTYGHVDKLPAGGFLVALRDSRGSGHADLIKRFGDGVTQGSAGGTGIALYHDALYAEVNDRIVRYSHCRREPWYRRALRRSSSRACR